MHCGIDTWPSTLRSSLPACTTWTTSRRASLASQRVRHPLGVSRAMLTIMEAEEKLDLPRKWFQLAVDCLYTSNFYTIHTLDGARAICILTLTAHHMRCVAIL